MSYIDNINKLLVPRPRPDMVALDLFAGAGGLALGFEAQGFETLGYEMDADCVATYNKNLKGKCAQEFLTPESELPKADVIIGGPPCQPFSVRGHQLGLKDSRDGFPTFIAAVARIRPKVWIFENVRGLMYRNAWYLDQVLEALRDLGYVVEAQVLNAKHYGVPQNRERVIVVGHTGKFVWPKRIDGYVTAGEALGELAHQIPPDARFLTPSMDRYVAVYEKASFCTRPRDLHLDEPARTLTCRNIAACTSDMHRIRLEDGRRRRITIREAARLQSFPDWFEFDGNELSQFYQIGNAVPPLLAYRVAERVLACVESPLRLPAAEIYKRRPPVQLDLFRETEVPYSPRRKRHVVILGEGNSCKTFASKRAGLQKLINQALEILSKFGIPMDGPPRRLERMALAFMAVANVKKPDDWPKAQDIADGRSLTTREIITYVNDAYGEDISPGSYDDIRRQDLKLPLLAGVIVPSAPGSNRNAPGRGYALSTQFSEIIRKYGEAQWDEEVEHFTQSQGKLAEELEQLRHLASYPVTFPSGEVVHLEGGEHNLLQKKIVEDFLPRFGSGAEVLYLADAKKRDLFMDEQRLNELRFFELRHGELPDVVAYSPTKNWLFLIEAVRCANPITPIRLKRLKELTRECTCGIVFVSAFLTRSVFRKFSVEIAWETEVWIAENPDHLLHFNGERFLGPYEAT